MEFDAAGQPPSNLVAHVSCGHDGAVLLPFRANFIVCIDAGFAEDSSQLLEYQRVDKVVTDRGLPFVYSDVTCGSLKRLTRAGLASELVPDDPHVSIGLSWSMV